jgi:superfamily II DNA or RNA helicase
MSPLPTNSAVASLAVGEAVVHGELGEGVLVRVETAGYARVFFRQHGERQVLVGSLARAAAWDEQIVTSLLPASPDALRRLWLAIEAERLPLMDGAAALTSAKVDLLPHQIVLTYRIANASPRRFLVADAVGLGKTIETALLLRELASRGELTRALMVVPAGLVDNWRRELNETFSLDFEVFGWDGDVTDRRSNAFAKHNRLIVSIDTLKRPARVKRLLEAARWDLTVFDEAHHLTAYEAGNKVRRTQNFKLAEALREHTRDLLLLSATPHQGDHFRFWMLIRLLDSRLFESSSDMIANRHRLNSVVFRRTQADACNANGEPLFARRQVHTSAFHLSDPEKKFYESLMSYLRDGYNLAASRGGKGRSLGFVMTIFQKIASSSFAAVASTLRRRLLMLTIHEALVCDDDLDTNGRDRALSEARELVRSMHGLGDDQMSRAAADRLLADAKVQLLRRLDTQMSAPPSDTELTAAGDEEAAAAFVAVALPEERKRIRELLSELPGGSESKTEELLRGFGELWVSNPREKVVVFTTYLGSVDTLRMAIDRHYPEKGVEVLKGGDQGAKIAAEKRFRNPDGPRVLICTAAGREGINLQFARVLFNHDLPWNPMDVEQRIGRIHRYGQRDTAQVYNIVSADTIEGQIFMLLEQKLLAIAQALGKVDEHGQVTEDLRGQVLGQLAERISYEQLYQDAVRDPTLKRTRQELEVALENAKVARNVVFELFQDLETFNVEDYRRFDDAGAGMNRLLEFIREWVQATGGALKECSDAVYEAQVPGQESHLFSTNRETAKCDDSLGLLGLEHPLVRKALQSSRELPARARALMGRIAGLSGNQAILAVWRVEIQGANGFFRQAVIPVAVDTAGHRVPTGEALLNGIRDVQPALEGVMDQERRRSLIDATLPGMLRRDIEHRGLLREGTSLSTHLIAWIEFC